MKKNIYLELFLVFFKIGAFTIGGGYAMVPLIKEALVDKKKWLTDNEFVDSLAVAQSAPGILAVNTAIITGQKIAGTLGTVAGTLGAVLPSFLMILALATCLSEVRNSKIFISFFNGIKPVTVALIFISVIKMGKSAKINLKTAVLPLAVGLIVAYTFISPIVVIIFTMIAGNIYFKKKMKRKGGRMIYLQLFAVFFRIGLFSFGGGYAVLSLIQKDVVEKFGWVSVSEFTEIVALSQVTPGPIAINSATYIGYTVTGNVFGSMFTTLGVVMPSFIVLLFSLLFLTDIKIPLVIERAFKALRPVVLGLILAAGLALLKPENFIDIKSYIIFAGAVILSLKWNVGVIPLIIGSGILGIILYL